MPRKVRGGRAVRCRMSHGTRVRRSAASRGQGRLLVLTADALLLGSMLLAFQPDHVGDDAPRLTKAQVDLRTLDVAVRSFRARHHRLPESLSELAAKDADGRSELEELPQDPWGHDYLLQATGGPGKGDWTVWSLGPDGWQGTGDDLRSGRRR